jgi:hypothetical protein
VPRRLAGCKQRGIDGTARGAGKDLRVTEAFVRVQLLDHADLKHRARTRSRE